MLGQLVRLSFRGVRDMALHPWAQLLSLVAVAMVALLAGVFMMLLYNVDQELIRDRGQVQFQVYWKPEFDQQRLEAQWAELKTLSALKEMDVYTPRLALADLAATLGDAGDFGWLEGHNPLPPTASLSFAIPGANQEGWAARMLKRLKSMDGVDRVHYNPMQMDLAKGWLAVSRSVVWPLIGFLGLVVALVVGNTIKLSLITRRDEVEILALVGARPWYVRWPLLTGGAVQGLLGAGLALGLLKLLQHQLGDVLNFPPIFLHIGFLPWQYAAGLAGGVVLVCIASSWVAVRS